MKRIPKQTLFARLFLGVLTPLMAAILFLASFGANTSYQSASTSARNSAIDFAANASKKVEALFSDKTTALIMTADAFEWLRDKTSDVEASLTDFLRMFMEHNKELDCVWFAFEKGQALPAQRFVKHFVRRDGQIEEFFDLDDSLLDSPELAPWYHEPLKTGKVYFDSFDIHNYGDGGIYKSSISSPILYHGAIVGVIGMDIFFDNLFAHFDQLQIPGARSVMLLGPDGKVTYSSDKQNLNRPVKDFIQDHDNLIKNALQNRCMVQGEFLSHTFGEKSFVNIHPLALDNASDPLYLLLDMPTAYLYAPAVSILRSLMLAGFAALLLIFVILWWVARHLSRPITQLTRLSNHIAEGKLDVTFDGVSDYREITELQASLQTMTALLKNNLRQQAEFTQTLEAKIEERTQELRLMTCEAKTARKAVEEAAEAKTLFFANMSHEIRTPMNAILGMSELLLLQKFTPEQHHYIANIHSSSQSLLTIINDILDLSKLEFGKLSLVCDHYDLPLLLSHLNSMFSFVARQKGLDYRFTAQGPLPKCLYGDRDRLKQVLTNLLSNAVKFTEQGLVEMRITVFPSALQFDIVDVGVGIHEKDIPLLFDPFQQFSMNQTRAKGTGLGLSICKSLVGLMGGTIHVQSEYGVGSTFTVYLPKTLGNESALADQEETLALYAPQARVLVVDDDPVNLVVAKGFLNQFGIAPDTADSGEEALAKIETTAYHLVLMDHMMPRMSGVETARRIRAQGGALQALVIVALSANAVAGARETFLAAGMNDFLPKPIERKKLVAILDQWLPPSVRERPSQKDALPPLSLAEASSPLLAALQRDPRVDYAPALDRMGGRAQTYFSVLTAFLKTTGALVEQADSALATHALPRFCVSVHALKSTLMTLGLTELARQAKELEAQAKMENREECQKTWQGFATLLKAFLLDYAAFTAPEPSPPLSKGDPAFLQSLLLPLAERLEMLEYEGALALLHKLSTHDFGGEVQQTLGHVQLFLDQFDCDSALALVRELRRSLEEGPVACFGHSQELPTQPAPHYEEI